MTLGHILLALLIGFGGGCAVMYLLRPYDNKSCYDMEQERIRKCKK